MKREEMNNYLGILERELVPALGCTEPIAVAYAAAKARAVLGEFPKHIDMRCSGNIVKNVKGVNVPNSNGMIGIEAAAILGAVAGDADNELEVLESVKPEDVERTRALRSEKFCSVSLEEGVENLFIVARAEADEHYVEVKIVNRHTHITEIIKDGEVIYSDPVESESVEVDWSKWSIHGILEFAESVDIEEVKWLLDRQMEMNIAISNEGLTNDWGARIGKIIMSRPGVDHISRAAARAAAGSDARMAGCSLPVVTNSGSGNQGITVCLPVVEYAEHLGASPYKLYRALLISNLASIYQKHFIGSLSSFCGAVTAAAAAGAAITYLHGGTYEQICNTIINTTANVGGIICDGAKASCAAKIASSVHAAIIANEMSMNNLSFQSGEGLVKENIENTIRSIGYVGRVGMMETDKTVLNIMIDKIDVC